MVSRHFPIQLISISDGIFKTTPSSESWCHPHPRHIRTATSWNLAEWHQHTTFASVSQMSAPPPHFWSWRGWYPRGERSGGKPSNLRKIYSKQKFVCSVCSSHLVLNLHVLREKHIANITCLQLGKASICRKTVCNMIKCQTRILRLRVALCHLISFLAVPRK